MLGLNNVQIIGNLGGTPDMKFLNDGKSQVVNFSVAVNERWKNRDGEPQERTTWLRVAAFNGIGQACAEYLVLWRWRVCRRPPPGPRVRRQRRQRAHLRRGGRVQGPFPGPRKQPRRGEAAGSRPTKGQGGQPSAPADDFNQSGDDAPF